jgi:ribosomal protein S27AE
VTVTARIAYAAEMGEHGSGIDPDDRHCPSCGTLMQPVGLPSGEIVSRCPRCRQVAI